MPRAYENIAHFHYETESLVYCVHPLRKKGGTEMVQVLKRMLFQRIFFDMAPQGMGQ